MSIFRRATFGSDLLVISNTFGVFLFFRVGLLFLAVTFIAGVVTSQGDKWRSQILTNGSMKV
jgi:hypothetical protein